jgi:hypothetical protein
MKFIMVKILMIVVKMTGCVRLNKQALDKVISDFMLVLKKQKLQQRYRDLGNKNGSNHGKNLDFEAFLNA